MFQIPTGYHMHSWIKGISLDSQPVGSPSDGNPLCFSSLRYRADSSFPAPLSSRSHWLSTRTVGSRAWVWTSWSTSCGTPSPHTSSMCSRPRPIRTCHLATSGRPRWSRSPACTTSRRRLRRSPMPGMLDFALPGAQMTS